MKLDDDSIVESPEAVCQAWYDSEPSPNTWNVVQVNNMNDASLKIFMLFIFSILHAIN